MQDDIIINGFNTSIELYDLFKKNEKNNFNNDDILINYKLISNNYNKIID